MTKPIELVMADITNVDTEAIVNAANSSLLGGGGVDGAIHRAAGSQLLEECRTVGGCPTGEARITKGYALKAKYIIHTVGPVWHGGSGDEEKLLVIAYKNALALAYEHKIESIAFPNISTGVYGFPKNLASKVAIEAVNNFLRGHKLPKKVLFVCFDEENYQIYSELLNCK